jgi:outer membrane lipoprotein-sorting protein
MRKLLSFLVLLFATFSTFAQAAKPAESENSKKARAILNQMIEALGGQAYLNVKDMKQEGRTYSFYQGKPNSVGTVFYRSWKFPDKDRTEYTKDRDVVMIFDGDKGYEITFKGTAEAEPEGLRDYIRRRNHSLENALRVWLPDPKTALFYDGTAVAEQKYCDSVTLLSSTNDSVTIYIDTHTHLPVKKTFEWRDPLDRLKNTEAEIFDAFRLEDGVMTPHTLLRSKNGDTTNQRFITSVKYNVGLPDSLFTATVTYDPYQHSGKRE